jgi:3-hydroxyacyl-CoA dehydrogenase
LDDGTRLQRHGPVCTITLAAPPVNALGHALRLSLDRALDSCLADADLRAIVIMAEGPVFSAGADIREFGAPSRAPLLTDLCRRIEEAQIPVIAVLQGAALGGGAEIALAAHYRLAGPAARIGLPEVRLGLVPGAGGTQRLPRLIGAEAALTLLTDGTSLDATAAEAIGLVDGLLPDPSPAAAVAFAEGLIARGLGPRPTLMLRDFIAEGAFWLAAVAAARATFADTPLMAQRRIVDCVEAALLLPPDEGLGFERIAFEDCLASPASAALRHLFLAERRVPAALGRRGADGMLALTAEGQGLAQRLDAALGRAAAALVRGGLAAAAVDAAIVDLGFAAGPFGGTATGGSGPVARCLTAAVMAEGGRLLAEGVVARTADIDAIAVAGAGWPRLTGGPMHHAGATGLAALLQDMAAWGTDDPVWDPPPALREAVKYAGGFDALDAQVNPGSRPRQPA